MQQLKLNQQIIHHYTKELTNPPTLSTNKTEIKNKLLQLCLKYPATKIYFIKCAFVMYYSINILRGKSESESEINKKFIDLNLYTPIIMQSLRNIGISDAKMDDALKELCFLVSHQSDRTRWFRKIDSIPKNFELLCNGLAINFLDPEFNETNSLNFINRELSKKKLLDNLISTFKIDDFVFELKNNIEKYSIKNFNTHTVGLAKKFLYNNVKKILSEKIFSQFPLLYKPSKKTMDAIIDDFVKQHPRRTILIPNDTNITSATIEKIIYNFNNYKENLERIEHIINCYSYLNIHDRTTLGEIKIADTHELYGQLSYDEIITRFNRQYSLIRINDIFLQKQDNLKNELEIINQKIKELSQTKNSKDIIKQKILNIDKLDDFGLDQELTLLNIQQFHGSRLDSYYHDYIKNLILTCLCPITLNNFNPIGYEIIHFKDRSEINLRDLTVSTIFYNINNNDLYYYDANIPNEPNDSNNPKLIELIFNEGKNQTDFLNAITAHEFDIKNNDSNNTDNTKNKITKFIISYQHLAELFINGQQLETPIFLLFKELNDPKYKYLIISKSANLGSVKTKNPLTNIAYSNPPKVYHDKPAFDLFVKKELLKQELQNTLEKLSQTNDEILSLINEATKIKNELTTIDNLQNTFIPSSPKKEIPKLQDQPPISNIDDLKPKIKFYKNNQIVSYEFPTIIIVFTLLNVEPHFNTTRIALHVKIFDKIKKTTQTKLEYCNHPNDMLTNSLIGNPTIN